MPGDFARFAANYRRLTGAKRGRPAVLSSQRFYPGRWELELSQLLRNALSASWASALSEALGRLSDDGDDPFGEAFSEKLRRIASGIVSNAGEGLANFSEMTIGAPYYPPAVAESVRTDWENEFGELCKSADAQGKADIARAVYAAKAEGKNKAQIEAEVSKSLPGKAKSRAELIARTETGKLNNAATMATYKSCGISYYRWLATPDERTRPEHAALNGLICAVGDPDGYYEENPDDPLNPVRHPRTAGMYHGDPGTDFQCRCCSVPWDPEIDGNYEIKERPEGAEPEEPKKSTGKAENERLKAELEKNKQEAAEKQKGLENALKKAERRAEILQAANERHSRRTEAESEKIRTEWRKRNAEKAHVLPKKIATVKDVQVVMDNYLKKYPNETEFPKINVTTFNKAPSRNGGFTLMWASRTTHEIGFNTHRPTVGLISLTKKPSPFDNLKNAFLKIHNGNLLGFEEEYSLESFYHEINHTKAKKMGGFEAARSRRL